MLWGSEMVGVMGGWLTDGAQEVSVCGKSQGRQEFLTGSGPENGGTAWNRSRI